MSTVDLKLWHFKFKKKQEVLQKWGKMLQEGSTIQIYQMWQGMRAHW
jgi:hypothetical protein